MKQNNLVEIASLFLKLGIIGFGGPAAHIALMQKEVVEKQKWMSQQHFLDLIGATNLIPGPNSTEMAIHIGREKGGWKGLLLAGICFILPAVLITACLAYFYKEYGQVPQLQTFIFGIKPAIIAVILSVIIPLTKKYLQSLELAIIGGICLLLCLLHTNEFFVMFGAGCLALSLSFLRNHHNNQQTKKAIPLVLLQITTVHFSQSHLLHLFLIFLKIGAILYGSGYVLFAFLDAELVTTGLLSRQQLIDAIAVGQFTPGPVFSAVTFIGYQIAGTAGAIVATIGIFLPSFLYVALLNPLVEKMRNSPVFASFLDAVNIASVAIILSVCVQMSKDTLTDWRSLLIASISLLILLRFPKLNSAWIVISAGIVGYGLCLI